jgi:type I restriction enzyme S subunit
MFQACTIGDFVEAGTADIQTGPFGTQLKASEYVPDGVPVINVRNIGYADLRTDKLEFVTETKAEQLSVHRIEPNDIVFGRKGAVDRHLFVQPDHQGWVQGSDCIRLRIASDDIHPRYVSYAMLSEQHKKWMLNQCGNKATMASLNQDVVKRIALRMPQRLVQNEIVAILSAYDDLIENNRRRITLLEEGARQLYKEWFVRFRFPGHEHVKIIDGVPEGWAFKVIEEVCETIGGGTPSTKKPEYWDDGDLLWFTPTDVTRNSCLALLTSETKISGSGLNNSSAKMIPAGAIMMTSRASVGFFGINRLAASTNQGFINIVSHDPTLRMYVLQNLMWRVEEIRSHAGGATYKEISKGRFRALPILVPPLALASEFEDQASLIHAQVETLHIANQQLAKARDLLLPKLMSGAIAV